MQRARAAFSCWMLDLERAREQREERNALVRAGEALSAAGPPPPVAPSAELASAWERAREVRAWRARLDERLAASLEADRHDYRAAASALGRWLVVGRGLLERLRLRDEVWRGRDRRSAELAGLARLALEEPALASRIPAADQAEIARARAALARVEGERARLLAPYGGQALPAALRGIRTELGLFARSLKAELSRKLFLRLPALAAMAVVWWLTRSYTTSALEASWHRLTGEGRAGLSRATLEQLRFWLPLVAATLTAYLTATIGRRVQLRYGRESAGEPR